MTHPLRWTVATAVVATAAAFVSLPAAGPSATVTVKNPSDVRRGRRRPSRSRAPTWRRCSRSTTCARCTSATRRPGRTCSSRPSTSTTTPRSTRWCSRPNLAANETRTFTVSVGERRIAEVRRVQGLRPLHARAPRRLRVGERSRRAPHVRRGARVVGARAADEQHRRRLVQEDADAGRQQLVPRGRLSPRPRRRRRLLLGGQEPRHRRKRPLGGRAALAVEQLPALAGDRQRPDPPDLRAVLRGVERQRAGASARPSASRSTPASTSIDSRAVSVRPRRCRRSWASGSRRRSRPSVDGTKDLGWITSWEPVAGENNGHLALAVVLPDPAVDLGGDGGRPQPPGRRRASEGRARRCTTRGRRGTRPGRSRTRRRGAGTSRRSRCGCGSRWRCPSRPGRAPAPAKWNSLCFRGCRDCGPAGRAGGAAGGRRPRTSPIRWVLVKSRRTCGRLRGTTVFC